MKKLRLSLDALTVESFETYTAPFLTGTVKAHDADTEGASNCKTCDTCGAPNCPKCGCADSTLV